VSQSVLSSWGLLRTVATMSNKRKSNADITEPLSVRINKKRMVITSSPKEVSEFARQARSSARQKRADTDTDTDAGQASPETVKATIGANSQTQRNRRNHRPAGNFGLSVVTPPAAKTSSSSTVSPGEAFTAGSKGALPSVTQTAPGSATISPASDSTSHQAIQQQQQQQPQQQQRQQQQQQQQHSDPNATTASAAFSTPIASPTGSSTEDEFVPTTPNTSYAAQTIVHLRHASDGTPFAFPSASALQATSTSSSPSVPRAAAAASASGALLTSATAPSLIDEKASKDELTTQATVNMVQRPPHWTLTGQASSSGKAHIPPMSPMSAANTLTLFGFHGGKGDKVFVTPVSLGLPGARVSLSRYRHYPSISSSSSRSSSASNSPSASPKSSMPPPPRTPGFEFDSNGSTIGHVAFDPQETPNATTGDNLKRHSGAVPRSIASKIPGLAVATITKRKSGRIFKDSDFKSSLSRSGTASFRAPGNGDNGSKDMPQTATVVEFPVHIVLAGTNRRKPRSSQVRIPDPVLLERPAHVPTSPPRSTPGHGLSKPRTLPNMSPRTMLAASVLLPLARGDTMELGSPMIPANVSSKPTDTS
jgi:hypothetical protein